MKKKIILSVVAFVMMGLSACEESKTFKDETCTTGSQKCDGNAIYACPDGTWSLDKKCDDGKVCDAQATGCVTATLCTANTRRCNLKAVEFCNGGLWEVEQKCTGADVCNDLSYKCEAPIGLCSTDTKRCQGKAVEICKNGAWEIQSQCTGLDVCDPDTFTCKKTSETCTLGSLRCSDNKLQTCEADGWGAGVACALNQECKTNASSCTTNPDYCAKNADCQDPLYPRCNVNKNSCECVSSSLSCQMVDGKGVISTCFSGKWDAGEPCSEIVPVCNVEATACVECTTSKQCNISENRNVCDTLTNRCQAITACHYKDTECVGKVFWSCGFGAWVPETCAGNCTLNGCRCVNETKLCQKNQLYTCKSGYWENPVPCETGKECKTDDTQCTRSANYCDGVADCKNPLYPECYMKTCICQDKQAACKIENGQAKYSNCASGVWNSYMNCPSGMTKCNATSTQCSN